MKQVINLTENELKILIKETVEEILNKYLITEMAVSLSEYKDKAESLMQQIIENWCLIRYATLTGDKEEIKNHWKSELITHMTSIASTKIKKGNSLSTKTNALFSLWNKKDWDTDEKCISLCLYAKFLKENIPTEGDVFAQIISDFKNDTKKIIYALTSESGETIKYYVNNI